ncbi:MAG: hypothetical protein QOH35_4468 [Acidobacteriaceae bacterium]|jgi:hypothetical protein|nr:hypothetical protein [Acidobacteriaceae bacterium]
MASSSSVVAALGESAGPAASLNVDASKAANCFDPDKSLGSSMDDLSIEVIRKFTPRKWSGNGSRPAGDPSPISNHGRPGSVQAGANSSFPRQRGRQRWWEDSSISDVLL